MKSPLSNPLISLCMIVKNEGELLRRCLTSVRGVVDEIIIVDTGSTDSTVQIAHNFGATVVHHSWSGNFAAARNAGLQHARGQWILVLDGDEELDPTSTDELMICAEHIEYEAFFLRINNHKGLSPASLTITINPIIRMFRNRPQYRFKGIIHEQIAEVILSVTPGAAMHLTTINIHHYGYAEGVVVKKDKINRNVELLKEQLKLHPKDPFHHFNMAVEYMRLGEYQAALAHINNSLEEAPADTSYIHLLYKYEIRCLTELKNYTEALTVCDRGISIYPDYPDLLHIKGVLLSQLGALTAAKAALLQAAVIGPAPPGYHTESGFGSYLTFYMLGQLCDELGAETEAIACYTKSAQQHPEPTPILARLVRSMKCAGRTSEIYSWLHIHLPELVTVKRGILLELLQGEGCHAAAEELMKATDPHSNEDLSIATNREGLAFHPAYQRGRAQLISADHQLATLSSSCIYSPVIHRARLALPLPRVSD